jgi:hypothetical protein
MRGEKAGKRTVDRLEVVERSCGRHGCVCGSLLEYGVWCVGDGRWVGGEEGG